MIIVHPRNAVPIRLTDERWLHVVRRHPEMVGQRERVLETIAEPDQIQQGDFRELLAIRFYPMTPLTNKFLVVAYKETEPNDGFVVTAYFSNKPSARRRELWKR